MMNMAMLKYIIVVFLLDDIKEIQLKDNLLIVVEILEDLNMMNIKMTMNVEVVKNLDLN
jgi:hypothetical protein